MFVGEAPGADEDVQGIPFVGRAGQLLTKIIEAIGLRRDEVYIANVIKCRPPGNRNPEPDEVATCEPFLFRQIDAIAAEGHRRARHVRGQDAAQDERPDLAPARPGLRLPRREADADVPPGVPAAQPGPQARRLGGHEEGPRPAAGPRRRHRVAAMRLVSVAVPVPGLDALTYALPDGLPGAAASARACSCRSARA